MLQQFMKVTNPGKSLGEAGWSLRRQQWWQAGGSIRSEGGSGVDLVVAAAVATRSNLSFQTESHDLSPHGPAPVISLVQAQVGLLLTQRRPLELLPSGCSTSYFGAAASARRKGSIGKGRKTTKSVITMQCSMKVDVDSTASRVDPAPTFPQQ